MSHESLPIIQEAIFYPDGSLNESLLIEQYGIGAGEAMLEVTFGNYRGTIAQMLSNDKCPVGHMVKTAYEEKGLDGVVETFKTLTIDDDFSARLTKETLRREEEKITSVETPRDPRPTVDKPSAVDSARTTNKPEQQRAIKPEIGLDAIKDQKSDDLLPVEGTLTNGIARSVAMGRIVKKLKPSFTDQETLKRNKRREEKTHLSQHQTKPLTAAQPSAQKSKLQKSIIDTSNDLENSLDFRNVDHEEFKQFEPIIHGSDVIEIIEADNNPEDSLDDPRDGVLFISEYPDSLDTQTEIQEILIQDSKDPEFAQLHESLTVESSPGNNAFQDFEEELNIYLESFEQTQIDDIKSIIETMKTMIDKSYQLTEQSTDEEKRFILQSLQQLCSQLFDNLEIECSENTVNQFIESLVVENSIVHTMLSDGMSIRRLNHTGTHEYKPYADAILSNSPGQQNIQSFLILSQYMLRMHGVMHTSIVL
ncbi:MAG TPA: hypothetical protein VMV24_02610 [Candidatus Dormibacteraeota bacterium]|nr:hypothetical protein [Candidatus Dormibacteraeota bacterium]